MSSPTIIATTSTALPPLPADAFKLLLPEAYQQRFIREGVRPDGRLFPHFRPTAVHYGSISSADGSALVRLGGTTVVCGIKAEVAVPDCPAPDQGFFVPNVELGPLCSAQFRPGPPSETAQVIAQRLSTLAKDTVRLEDLIIHPGAAAWVIYADIICLNADGGLLDACQLALTAALRHLRLRKAIFIEEEGAVRADPADLSPLRTLREVHTSTFAFLETGECLADPSEEESCIVKGQVSISIGEDGALAGLWQEGGIGTDADSLKECIRMAKERRTLLQGILDASSTA